MAYWPLLYEQGGKGNAGAYFFHAADQYARYVGGHVSWSVQSHASRSLSGCGFTPGFPDSR